MRWMLNFLHSRSNPDPNRIELKLPNSITEMERFINAMPQLQPFKPRSSPKSVRYQLRDIIANIAAEKDFLRNHVFCSNDLPLHVSEVFESSEWNKYFNKQQQDEGYFPFVIALYYDDFSKYRFVSSSMGGLYISLLNARRDLISIPENIHCLGLINSEADFHEIMDEFVAELEELHQLHRVKASNGEEFLSRVFLGLILADSPQRQLFCGMHAITSNVQCKDCEVHKDDHYFNPSGFQNHTNLFCPCKSFPARTVPTMRIVMDEWRMSRATQRLTLEQTHGIKPRTNIHGLYVENPFYRLYDLYGFDVYADTPVDFFHVAIIGLFPQHVELFHASLPTNLKTEFDQHYSTFKYNNRTLKPFSTRNYWMGEVHKITCLFIIFLGVACIFCYSTLFI
jgi:hypothetical protein